MNQLLIVGAGGFGRVVLERAEKNFSCAFIDDNVPIGSEIDGAKVVGKISDLRKLTAYENLIVAIGDNKLRERVYKEAARLGFSFPNVISPSAFISTRASIGKGCIILNNVVILSGVRAGNGIILNPGVELHNDSFVDDYALLYSNSVVRTNAHVGKRAWIGSTVTISTGETVPDDTVITDKAKKERTFKDLWGEIIATGKLPEMASLLMHKSFSNETKKALVDSSLTASEIADLLNKVITMINKGSVIGIDDLVRKELKK